MQAVCQKSQNCFLTVQDPLLRALQVLCLQFCCPKVYDPEKISLVDILRWFWESHDPTQGNAQGNDHGTQYRLQAAAQIVAEDAFSCSAFFASLVSLL